MKGTAKIWRSEGVIRVPKSYSKRRIIIRDDKSICFVPCNNAQKQAGISGPHLCALDSQFEIDYRACKDCIILAWGNRGANFNYTAVEIFKLESQLQYCASTTAPDSLERADASAQVSFISLLSKFETPTTTAYSSMPATTTSQRLTISIITMIPTDPQSTPEVASTNSNHTSWTIIGTGVALGIVVLAVISTVTVFFLRRGRRHQHKEHPTLKQRKINNRNEDKSQLHSESFIRFELSPSLRRVPELLGLQKPKPELPVHEKVELTAERPPLEAPAVEPVGSELPV